MLIFLITNSSDDVSSKLVYVGWDFGDRHYDNSRAIPLQFWNRFFFSFFKFFWWVSLYLVVSFLLFLALVSSFLVWRWSSDSRPLLEFRSSCPRSPRREMLKRIVTKFWFSFSFWNCAADRHTRLKKAQRCASFPNLTDVDLTPASSSVSLPGSFSILLTHMGLTVQLGYMYICSISVAAMIIIFFSSSAKLLMHVWNALFCFRGRERSHSFNAVDPASIERCIEEQQLSPARLDKSLKILADTYPGLQRLCVLDVIRRGLSWTSCKVGGDGFVVPVEGEVAAWTIALISFM